MAGLGRVTLIGLGSVGGAIAAALLETGITVRAVARGPHGACVASDGLTVRAPWGDRQCRLEVASTPNEFPWDADDIIVLATKSQDTSDVVDALREMVPAACPVVCAQNGVANERAVAAVFENVYPMMVYAPLSHLEPGVVETWSSLGYGLLDIGRLDGGRDAVASGLAVALTKGGFDCRVAPDVTALKRVKLLYNLGNVLQLLCGADVTQTQIGPIRAAAMAEAEAVYAADGFDVGTERARFLARIADLSAPGFIDGRSREGGSAWQSGARGKDTEVRFLNGEVVSQAAAHGLSAPVNAALVALDARLRAGEFGPGTIAPEQVLAGAQPA